MAYVAVTPGLAQALEEVGFPLPDHCRNVSLEMGVDAAFVMKYEVLLTTEQLAKLGVALQKMGTEQS